MLRGGDARGFGEVLYQAFAMCEVERFMKGWHATRELVAFPKPTVVEVVVLVVSMMRSGRNRQCR